MNLIDFLYTGSLICHNCLLNITKLATIKMNNNVLINMLIKGSAKNSEETQVLLSK